MKSIAAIILIFGALVAAPVRAEVEFAGYVTHGTETRFTLVDGAINLASGWLPVGGSFGGCTVVAFDARTETLTLERPGATLRLQLMAPGGQTKPVFNRPNGAADKVAAEAERRLNERKAELEERTARQQAERARLEVERRTRR